MREDLSADSRAVGNLGADTVAILRMIKDVIILNKRGRNRPFPVNSDSELNAS
jgi:hypothetical protein